MAGEDPNPSDAAVSAFIASHSMERYCTRCLALEFGVGISRMRQIVAGLVASGQVNRQYGRCTIRSHGTSTIVISAGQRT